MIYVVNKKTHVPTGNDVYIGRGSVLGNSFTHKPLSQTKASFQVATRDEAVNKYKEYLDAVLTQNTEESKFIRQELNKIFKLAQKGDVYLVCYCKPAKCHGDVIREMIESVLKKR